MTPALLQRGTVRPGQRDVGCHGRPRHRTHSHTATLLPNGKVLVAGGPGTVGNSAELYDIGLGFMRPDWQPQIDTATSPLVLGSSLILNADLSKARVSKASRKLPAGATRIRQRIIP